MSKKNVDKRPRATNFSFREKELLLKIALENRNILENKESNAVSWRDKNSCWTKIAEIYNSSTIGCPRDATSLRLKYESVKKLLRGTKSDLFKTGGGPFKDSYTISSDSEKTLFQIMQVSIEGLPSQFDSDTPLAEHSEIKLKDGHESVKNNVDSMFDCEEVLGLEDIFLQATDEIPSERSMIQGHDPNDDVGKIDVPSTSTPFKNTQSWTPLDSTKLLKSTQINKKLTTKFKKNHCQASASETFTILAKKKQDLVELQMSCLKEEHKENMIFLKKKHELELQSIQLDISIKKQNLNEH